MGKPKHKISNWKQYNQALVQRGSLTIWMDASAIRRWHCHTHHGRRGRGFHYSDTAIETALMLKGLFNLPLRALEGFINSLFKLMLSHWNHPITAALASGPRRWKSTIGHRARGQ